MGEKTKDEHISSLRLRNGPKEKSANDTVNEPQVSSDVHAELAEGCTYSGKKFLVPKTADTLQVFFDPKHMNIGTLIAVIPIWINLYLSFVVKVPIIVNIVIFFFFRACYNAGLGYLLNAQSKHNQMVKWYKQLTKDPNQWYAKLVYRLVVGGLPAGKKPEDYPEEFNAWIWYKSIVNASLVNDSTSYTWLAIRCFEWPTEFTFTLFAQWSIAALLFIFNWWAKVDAHRCIGTYCWYWGDFFYRKNVSLTFDGIFELFPHPMYTVGYTAYYGICLLTRSHTVLLVSLVAHVSQLLFLVVVEEPHIKRTYGDSDAPRAQDEALLYDPREGLFAQKPRLFGIFPFSVYSAHTWTVVALTTTTLGLALLCSNKWWAVVLVAVWRFVHWGGLGTLLWFQSNKQVFTRYHESLGRPLHVAFHQWQHMYSLSCIASGAAFLGCFLRFVHIPTIAEVFTTAFLAKLAVAIALCGLSFWTSWSTYVSVGAFGWFFGDFFIPPAKYRHQLCYTGIYRFLNNPDAVTGYAGMYGLALLTDDWALFVLALLSQALNMLFIALVEIPHMRRLYGHSQSGADVSVASPNAEHPPMRMDGPLSLRVKQLIRDTVPIPVDTTTLKRDADRIRHKAWGELYRLYSALASERQKQQSAGNKGVAPTLRCPRAVNLGQNVRVSYRVDAKHDESDWIGIYPLDVASAPGHSEGRWVYVPVGAEGEVEFPAQMLPATEGVYEFRYHRAHSYEVCASAPLVLAADAQAKDIQDAVASPVPVQE